MRITLFLIFLGALAACGTTSGKGSERTITSTSVNGSAGGQSFTVTSAAGFYDTAREYSGVFITDFAGSCMLLANGITAPPSTQVLAVELIANGIGMAPGPGTYTLGTTQNVDIIVSYVASDAKCAETVNERATGGSVTLDTVDTTTVTGTFDVTFATGDHLTGQFDAPVCNIDITNLGSNARGCVGGDK